MLFMGIDVGTQGVRCVVADSCGRVVASGSAAFERLNVARMPGHCEQAPEMWLAAARDAIRTCSSVLKNPEELLAISVDGTSGTILALDASMRPLTNGIMYNDPRASEQARRVHEQMGSIERKLGYRFGASFSLPRALWIRDELSDIYARTAHIVHQADYITGMLCGEYAVSDYSNALKTGYDLISDRWPKEYETQLGLDISKLPRIVAPGAPIARVTRAAAQALGLSTRTWVVGGSTDGYASALAAGAVVPGHWVSIIGTTFVLKGVTERLIIDPNGSSYSHMLPGGHWLLGGAANLGGRVLNAARGACSFEEMNERAKALVPTGVRAYPLAGRGERFPFVLPDCEGFYMGDLSTEKLYPAIMEGVGFAERMAFEHMQSLGCTVEGAIYATGGACKSPLWLKLRASILRRELRLTEISDAAMGSALLAASGHFGGLRQAASAMLRERACIEPDPQLAKAYDEIYARFREDVRRNYAF